MILLVEDDALFRKALRRVFSDSVDAMGRIVDAVRLAAKHQPDVILLDVKLEDGDGIEAIPDLLQASPRSRIVVFTAFTDTMSRMRAFRRGAVGYIDKMHIRRIGEIVEEIASGGEGLRRHALH